MISRSDAGDARSALARDLVAGGDVDDVDGDVGEFRAKGRRQVVAAGFHEDDSRPGKRALISADRREIDRGVLADRGMRAAAGLDAEDAVGPRRRNGSGTRRPRGYRCHW